MTTSNTTLMEMGKLLQEAKSVLLFSHVNPDGDAVGSCAALCRLLRNLGIEAWFLIEEPVPEYVEFIAEQSDRKEPLVTMDLQIIPEPDVCICLDCNDEKRFPKRTEAFHRGRVRMCIDHHHPKDCDFDYYYIDDKSPAACQIIWELFHQMGWEFDEFSASAVYAGISTDTGSFQYSNTTPQTFRIAAELLECGVNINDINVKLYQNVDPKTFAVRSIGMKNMEMLSEGRAMISSISMAEMEECGARMEHTEDFVEEIRSIRGVEMTAFLRETENGIRVSMRSKNNGNVASIAVRFGGGGHTKAAGCTIHEPLDQAVDLIREAMLLEMEKLS